MDFEPWWLIFVPLVFGLGWLAARFDIRQMLSETRNLPDSYFKGLNFLLNEQPDRAIDAFVEVAKLDPETTELHFALGSLFRRRGEIERAIRVHQSLLARPDLPAQQLENAQFALAQDFFKAGMFDRAEQGFRAILAGSHALDALRALIRIHEAEHDWPQAIEAVRQLQARIQEPVPELAHYYCELAQAQLDSKNPDFDVIVRALDAADNAVRQTGSTPASATRVLMLRAHLAVLQGDQAGQQAYLQDIFEAAPEFAGLVAQHLLDSYTASQRAELGLDVLLAQYQKMPTLDLFNVVFRALRRLRGGQQAWGFARQALRAQPSLLGLDRLLEVELSQENNQHRLEQQDTGDDDQPLHALLYGADLGLLRSMVHRHSQRLDRYACRQCGFEARRYYWQCPGCNGWETYLPRRLEETQ